MKNYTALYILSLLLCLIFVSCENKNETGNYSEKHSYIIHNTDSAKIDSQNVKLFDKKNVITDLKTRDKIIALTFDACETKTPSYFDNTILDYIIKEEIPATIFLSGKFVKRNSAQIENISKYKFIELENHSLNHFNNMSGLNEEKITNEVMENEKLILQNSDIKTKFFRFPAGNYNKRTLSLITNLGYSVVHWTFESGDAVKNISKKKLFQWVVYKTQPGSILIFHINGRGYRTGEVLPELVSHFKENGYKFVKLEDYIR